MIPNMQAARALTRAPEAPVFRPAEAASLATLADVHAALAELDKQRLAAHAILDGAEAAEAALLDRDASDHEHAAQDMRVRNARRTLTRLDRHEADIVARGAEIEEDRLRAGWLRHREAYREAAERLAQSGDELMRHLAVVNEVRRAAAAEGFCMPQVGFFIPDTLLYAHRTAARGLGDRPLVANEPQYLGPTVLVCFLKAFGQHREGTYARVPTERGRWLAERGLARPEVMNWWGDPLPPEPPRPRESP